MIDQDILAGDALAVLANSGFSVCSPAGQLPLETLPVDTIDALDMSDDLIGWGVDRVVQKLCQEPSLLSPITLNLVGLAEALQYYEVTGYILLYDIDSKALCKDLNIDKISQRASFIHVIEKLRLTSIQYRAIAEQSIWALHDIPIKDIGLGHKRKQLSPIFEASYLELDTTVNILGSLSAFDRLASVRGKIQELEIDVQELRSALAIEEHIIAQL